METTILATLLFIAYFYLFSLPLHTTAAIAPSAVGLPPSGYTPIFTEPEPEEFDFTALDVERLTLRQARKVAKALGLKQKVNRKDKALAQFIREIRQALRRQPELQQSAIAALVAA